MISERDSPPGPTCSSCLSPQRAPWACDPPPSSWPRPPSPACPSPPSAPEPALHSKTPCRTDGRHKALRGNLYLEKKICCEHFWKVQTVTKLVDATMKNEFLINAWVSERLLLLNDLVEVIPIFNLLPMELLELFLRIG